MTEAEPSPLSLQQEALWFLDRVAPDAGAYREPLVRRLTGPLDVDALRGALGDVVARHEALRVRFRSLGGRPVQVVEDREVPFALVDLTGAGAGRIELAALLDELSRAPLDLRAGVLLRVTVLRLAEAEHVLHLVIHHIACDDWSLAVLGHGLAERYAARLGGRPDEPASPAMQYPEYARWQRSWIAGGGLAGQVARWCRELTPLPPALELTRGRVRPPVPSYRGGRVGGPVDGWSPGDLAELAGRHGTTPFGLLLTVLVVLLHGWSRQARIAVGVPFANRRRPETRGTVGLFVNVLPVVADVEPAGTFAGLLADLRARTLAALGAQEVPFPLLVRELGLRPDPGRNPLYQVAMIVDQPPDPFLIPPLRTEELDAHPGIAKFDLMLVAGTRSSPLRLGFEYSEDVIDRPVAERMLGDLRALLGAVRSLPDASIDDLLGRTGTGAAA
jgi:Condensation domain